MREYSTLKEHAALFDTMSQAVGLDLQEEAISGRLQFDEISEAVLRCQRCAYPQHCAAQLAQQKNPPATVPDYCRNRDLLGFLMEEPA